MFEINFEKSNNNQFFIEMIDTKSTIVLNFFPELETLNLQVYNQKSIYSKNFSVEIEEVSFIGELSLDGNEFDIDIVSKDTNISYLKLNLYYSLDNNLVISFIDKNEMREIITLPEAIIK